MASDQKDTGNPRGILELTARERQERERSYRGQALKLFPHVCGRCGREFEGKRLRELTVHHKDHDHDNNPPDGSNWELLCVFCHDNEHDRFLEHERHGGTTDPRDGPPSLTHRPFANIADLLKDSRPKKD